MKNLQATPNGRRWHPLVVKLCLYLHYLSSGAYEVLRKSGCLVLPSGRTLRDYTHYIENKPGFSKFVDRQLAEMIGLQSLESWQKSICLVADEMKIKEGLVFDKHNGDLVGFTNLGKVNEEIRDFCHRGPIDESNKPMASTVFVIMVRGLTVDFNFPYASFPAQGLSGEKIAPLLMEATFRLECIINTQVLCEPFPL